MSNATWLSNYNVKRRVVDHYRKGRVFVAGDAAHIHSPAGGQGLNTGVQDAYNLGWKLALVLQGKVGAGLLQTYEEERRPVAEGVLRTSETGNRLFFSTNPMMAFFRRFVFLPLLRRPRVSAALLLKTAQLDLNYRGACLAWEEAPQKRGVLRRLVGRRGPHAGDRAPDARVRDAYTGAPTSLFDAFRGPHWTLLLFEGRTRHAANTRLAAIIERVVDTCGPDVQPHLVLSSPIAATAEPGAAVAVHLDAWGEAHKLYSARAATLVLVRPDGYIGFHGRTVRDGLFTYLDSVFSEARHRPAATDPASMETVPART